MGVPGLLKDRHSMADTDSRFAANSWEASAGTLISVIVNSSEPTADSFYRGSKLFPEKKEKKRKNDPDGKFKGKDRM